MYTPSILDKIKQNENVCMNSPVAKEMQIHVKRMQESKNNFWKIIKSHHLKP